MFAYYRGFAYSSLDIFVIKVKAGAEFRYSSLVSELVSRPCIFVSNKELILFLALVRLKDNTILVCRLVMWLICAFLRIVWGVRKGEGYSPSVRASIQPDTTVGTVRFRTQYLKHFSRSNFLLCPF